MRRFTHVETIRRLDPERDFAQIYRLTACHEFPFELAVGLQCALYRSFGVPEAAHLMAATGEMLNRPLKRAVDTVLLMMEIIHGAAEEGLDAGRAREAIAVIGRAHAGAASQVTPELAEQAFTPDHRLYALGLQLLVPLRHIEARGWRRLHEKEYIAAYTFYRELGHRMGVTAVPGSYAAFSDWLDDYERRRLRATEDSARLYAAAQGLMADRLPDWLGPVRLPVAQVLGTALLDPTTRDAVAAPPPPALAELAVHALYAARRLAVRWVLPPRRRSFFTPGARGESVYPHGYTIAELGPASPAAPTGEDARAR